MKNKNNPYINHLQKLLICFSLSLLSAPFSYCQITASPLHIKVSNSLIHDILMSSHTHILQVLDNMKLDDIDYAFTDNIDKK